MAECPDEEEEDIEIPEKHGMSLRSATKLTSPKLLSAHEASPRGDEPELMIELDQQTEDA